MSRSRKLGHRAMFLLSRTVYMTCCCGCCSALRPRYKRLVDNIFPAAPQDGLVKSNMEKLTFYSLSSPEKLDRIGEYLFQKASRDIYRRRHGFVVIAMEAMDQLLVACHAQTLNLFVESFLRMVQKLLESTDPQLQTLATQSFVRFANIEEDTPSYHRRYDFFVSKFSAMCHSSHAERGARDTIRLAGIQGLQGVIRKTVSDDLVENIWESQHMDKIVPSLLYNMQTAEKYETVSCLEAAAREGAEARPPRLAEACLRELVGRASFGHIRSVLRPVLTHFDRHDLWIPSDFAVHVFKIIMFSIQAAYSYSVVEALMQHLEAADGGARVRAARATVLSNIVALAAADTVGPSVLEIINNLLTNLRASVTRDTEKESSEREYQAALMEALGEFADHLPDYQKIDIMMFIVNKIPPAPRLAPPDAMLQTILLQSLLKVGGTYRTRELSKAFPGAFLDALLRMSAAEQPAARALVQRILHTLLDRRGNKARLQHPTVDYAELGLSLEPCSRQDLIFIGKHGYAIFSSLYDGLLLESNTLENVEAVYTTLALLVAELGCAETAPDIMQLALAIQQAGVSHPSLGAGAQCQLTALALALAALLAGAAGLARAAGYVRAVAGARRAEAPHLLPPLRAACPALAPAACPHLLLDRLALAEALAADGADAARLAAAAPYAPPPARAAPRHSWLEAGAGPARDSLADLAAPSALTEADSAHSSPGVPRKQYDDLDEEYRQFVEKYNHNHRPSMLNFGQYRESNEFWHWRHLGPDAGSGGLGRRLSRSPPQRAAAASGLSLEALRRAAGPPSDAERRDAERRRATLNNTFRTAPFDHLLAITQPKVEIKEKLSELFSSLSSSPLVPEPGAAAPSPAPPHAPPPAPHARSFQQDVPPYCKYFPELFLY